MKRSLFMSIAALALFLLPSAGLKGQEKKPVLSGEERVEMFRGHLKMQEESPYGNLEWQYLGPKNISGRCTDVEAISPRGGQYTIWVASATGGVWKSMNEGVTFTPVFDDMPTGSIGDLAIDPQDHNTVWVGTGEANIFRSSNAGCGVFKTSDGGETWENMGLNNTHTIGRVRIHPENSDIVFVAATGHEWTSNKERGVFRTTNGGKTWEKVLYINENTGFYDLVIDPQDPNTLYATSWQRVRLKWNDPRCLESHKHSGVWKSTDGGENWRKINEGLPAPNKRGRIGIDLCRSKPDVLYLLLDNYEIAYEAEEGDLDAYGRPKADVIKGAAVYRSSNGGESWEQVSGLVSQEQKLFMERHSATYGWVFGQIRVDPNDENTVYSLGLFMNVSTDGGKTFRRVTARDIHLDQHGLWIDPANSDYLLEVHDGGLSISYDKGKNWRNPIEALPLAQFYNIEYDFAEPFRVYGSIQDHHSFYAPVDLRYGRDNIPVQDFKHILGAEGSSHAVNPRDNNTIYASSFYGNLNRARISDYPSEQKNLMPERYQGEPYLRGQWVAPTILSPHNPEIVYHGMQYVMRSRDEGDTWDFISPDLTYNDPKKYGDISYQTISSLSESPLRFGLIYAGTDDGRLWRTKDSGKNWEEIRNGAVPERWVSRIVASRYDLGTVYMTQTGRRDDDFQVYVWKSTDFGDTWTDISGSIPVGPVNVIREDPNDPDILYAGTDAGVYISKDQGRNWEVLGNLPFAYVHDLKIHPRDNMIIIATHGRGMWVLDANPVNERNNRRRR